MFENITQTVIEKKQKIMFEQPFLGLTFSYFLANCPPLYAFNEYYILKERPND